LYTHIQYIIRTRTYIYIYIYIIINLYYFTAKKTDNLKEKSAIERIANALCDTSNDDIILPPPPQPDDIDSFLNLLGSRICRLSDEQKQEAFQRHLQLSYDMLKENSI